MLSCLVDCTLRMSRACGMRLYSLLLCIHNPTTSGCRLLLLPLLYSKPASHWVLYSLHEPCWCTAYIVVLLQH
jgi:hypothetical protein